MFTTREARPSDVEAQVRAEKAEASEVLVRSNAMNQSAQRLFARIGLSPAHHSVYRRSFAGAACR